MRDVGGLGVHLARAVAEGHAQAVTRAYEHGVTIAMGTDIALTGADLPELVEPERVGARSTLGG